MKVQFQVDMDPDRVGSSEFFKLKGQVLIDHGFLEIMPWMLAADKEIPVYHKGQQVEVKQIRITEGKVTTLFSFNFNRLQHQAI